MAAAVGPERPPPTSQHPGTRTAAAAVRGRVRAGPGRRERPGQRHHGDEDRVLSSLRADVLSDALAAAVERARSAHASGELLRSDLQREVSRGVKDVLAASGARADAMRSDIAMVMREIDAGGTVLRAAVEAGSHELQREVLAAVER